MIFILMTKITLKLKQYGMDINKIIILFRQTMANKFPKEILVVFGKINKFDSKALFREPLCEQSNLCRLAGAVRAIYYD